MAKVWDEIAHSYHKVSLISKPHSDKYNQAIDLIFKHKATRILDLGCGSGILEKKLFERGFKGEIAALDSSEAMLGIAQRSLNNVRGVNFKLFDLNQPFPFPGDSFDCGVAINIIFLLQNPQKFLQESRRVLKNSKHFILVNPKPGGSIIDFFKEHFKNHSFLNTIKNLLSIILNFHHILKVIIYQKKFDNLAKKGLVHYQTIDEIEGMLKVVGFEIKSVSDIQAGQNWIFVSKKSAN